MKLRTCVSPAGEFIYGIHQPDYRVTNLRKEDTIKVLGSDTGNNEHDNTANFPSVDMSGFTG